MRSEHVSRAGSEKVKHGCPSPTSRDRYLPVPFAFQMPFGGITVKDVDAHAFNRALADWLKL